jgi:hypothetical protein
LLDLFTVNGTNIASEGYPAAIGRINPNTAAPEILAAVLSGIQISSDRGIPASSLNDTAAIAANIVSNRPYSVLSDLYKVMNSFAARANYTPAFPVSVGGGTRILLRWTACAKRPLANWFNILLSISHVSDHCVGEALDPRGKPRGRAPSRRLSFFRISRAAESGRSSRFSEVSKAGI